MLEYHHRDTYAHGGRATVENITLRCHTHNIAQAVLDFGAAAVRGRRRSRSRGGRT